MSNSRAVPSVKWTVVAVEALDARHDVHAAVVDEVQQLRVDHRAVAVQVAGGGRREAVALGRAERDVDQRARHALLQRDRQPAEQRQLRARAPEQRLGLEHQPVADRDERLASRLRGVDGQVAAGVPGADHEHAVALEVVAVAVAAECSTRPAKCPGYSGTNGSQRWPLATITPS